MSLSIKINRGIFDRVKTAIAESGHINMLSWAECRDSTPAESVNEIRELPLLGDCRTTAKMIITLGQRLSSLNELLQMIAESLQGVETHLRQMAISSNPAPNYQRPLSEYPTFDWASIGATVLNRDAEGATAVEWNGQAFTRRSPENLFASAIWFSRSIGKDSDGRNKYVRLITFKPVSESGPIGAKAKKAIGS